VGRASEILVVVAALACGAAAAATACGFDGEGLFVGLAGGDAGAGFDGGGEAGPIVTAEGGTDGAVFPIDASPDPCVLGDGDAGVVCDGKCVNTARNHENCGGCGAACVPSSACEGTCVPVAVALQAMRYEIVCQDMSSPFCGAGAPPPAKTITLTGTSGKSYALAIRVRGVVEQNSYSGGTAGGAAGTNASFFIVGGAVSNTNWNTYSLAVSSPARTAFLNNGATMHSYVDAIDYKARIEAAAGATITLDSSSSDTLIARNRDQDSGAPIVVPAIPPAPAAFNGQFIQVDVESVSLAP
jgi:hypothetical protein